MWLCLSRTTIEVADSAENKIKMSCSESRPKKVELTCTYSKNAMTIVSIIHTTTTSVSVLTKTPSDIH